MFQIESGSLTVTDEDVGKVRAGALKAIQEKKKIALKEIKKGTTLAKKTINRETTNSSSLLRKRTGQALMRLNAKKNKIETVNKRSLETLKQSLKVSHDLKTRTAIENSKLRAEQTKRLKAIQNRKINAVKVIDVKTKTALKQINIQKGKSKNEELEGKKLQHDQKMKGELIH